MKQRLTKFSLLAYCQMLLCILRASVKSAKTTLCGRNWNLCSKTHYLNNTWISPPLSLQWKSFTYKSPWKYIEWNFTFSFILPIKNAHPKWLCRYLQCTLEINLSGVPDNGTWGMFWNARGLLGSSIRSCSSCLLWCDKLSRSWLIAKEEKYCSSRLWYIIPQPSHAEQTIFKLAIIS